MLAILSITETETEFPACLYKWDNAIFSGKIYVSGKPCNLKHSLGLIGLSQYH